MDESKYTTTWQTAASLIAADTITLYHLSAATWSVGTIGFICCMQQAFLFCGWWIEVQCKTEAFHCGLDCFCSNCFARKCAAENFCCRNVKKRRKSRTKDEFLVLQLLPNQHCKDRRTNFQQQAPCYRRSDKKRCFLGETSHNTRARFQAPLRKSLGRFLQEPCIQAMSGK